MNFVCGKDMNFEDQRVSMCSKYAEKLIPRTCEIAEIIK